MLTMAKLKVPIICVVIGEGSSGGALALGVGDRIVMLENAVYSILGEDQYGNIVSIEYNNWQDFENYCKNGFPIYSKKDLYI